MRTHFASSAGHNLSSHPHPVRPHAGPRFHGAAGGGDSLQIQRVAGERAPGSGSCVAASAAADGLEAETRTPDPGPRQQSHEDTPGRFSGSRERGPGPCGGCGAAPTPRGPLARGAGALLCINTSNGAQGATCTRDTVLTKQTTVALLRGPSATVTLIVRTEDSEDPAAAWSFHERRHTHRHTRRASCAVALADGD